MYRVPLYKEIPYGFETVHMADALPGDAIGIRTIVPFPKDATYIFVPSDASPVGYDNRLLDEKTVPSFFKILFDSVSATYIVPEVVTTIPLGDLSVFNPLTVLTIGIII
jgi:hypothetical protein